MLPAWSTVLNLKIGEVVEVRSEAEILATLDDRGEFESLPSCPRCEVLRPAVHRGQARLQVVRHHRGHRPAPHGQRVHLRGVRCDGQAHGGCQATCLVYWKEAWLKRIDADGDWGAGRTELPLLAVGAIVPMLMEATHEPADAASTKEAFSCQATELLRAGARADTAVGHRSVRRAITGSARAAPIRTGGRSAGAGLAFALRVKAE